jgi:hypothetical protein
MSKKATAKARPAGMAKVGPQQSLMQQAALLKGEAMAQQWGLDWGTFRKYVDQFGEPVLDLVDSLVNKGFTITWIQEAFEKLGPPLVEVIADAAGSAGPEGTQQFLGLGGASGWLRPLIKKQVEKKWEKLPEFVKKFLGSSDDATDMLVEALS